MDLTLTAEERQIRRAARELAEEQFADDAFTHFGEVPRENIDALAEHGYLGMTLPTEYGGADASFFEAMMAMEGIGSVCPETADLIATTNNGNAQIIAKFAAEKYKKEYLEPLCAGTLTTAIAMSEPQAGSAVTDMETQAEDDGDAYVLNGEKIWVSGAPDADVFNTYTRMPNGQVGSLLIDADNPGFEVQDPMINMAGEEQSQIFIEDCRVSKDRELVVGPDSFKEAIKTYNVNRVLGLGGSWVMAKWLFEEALDYAQTREQAGVKIGDHQGVSHRLADMATKLETSRWLIYRALSGDDLPGRALTGMTKIHAAKKLHEVADAALQTKAANGYVADAEMGDTPEAYAYKALRGAQIYGGTLNIHHNNVAKSLFKEGYPDLE